MALVIKKRVSLDFLGNGYEDAYLVFKSIPAIELEELTPKLEKLEKETKGSLAFVISILKDYFLSGEFPNDEGKLEPVNKEDLDQLDPNSVVKCFQVFTGQQIDPKDEGQSTSTSETVEALQSNS